MQKKIFLFILIAAVLCSSLASCGAEPVVMRYGNSEIPLNWYRYFVSTYKASFQRTYSDMKDTKEFWESIMTDGKTAETVLNDMVAENVKRTLVCMELFRQFGLKLDDAQKVNTDAYLDDLVKERANGSRKVLNQELAAFGINTSMLRDILEAQEKAGIVFRYLYGNNGPRELTDNDLEKYYRENYAHVLHIWINDAYRYETDDKGNYKFNAQGTVATRELTAEEKKEAEETVASVEKALNSGKDFKSVLEQYSEDTYYPNGYYLHDGSDFIAEVIQAAMEMNVGEKKKVVSDYGTHFLLKLENDPGAWKNEENSDFFPDFATDAKNADFMAYLDTLLPDVVTDEEIISDYSVRYANANYYY